MGSIATYVTCFSCSIWMCRYPTRASKLWFYIGISQTWCSIAIWEIHLISLHRIQNMPLILLRHISRHKLQLAHITVTFSFFLSSKNPIISLVALNTSPRRRSNLELGLISKLSCMRLHWVHLLRSITSSVGRMFLRGTTLRQFRVWPLHPFDLWLVTPVLLVHESNPDNCTEAIFGAAEARVEGCQGRTTLLFIVLTRTVAEIQIFLLIIRLRSYVVLDIGTRGGSPMLTIIPSLRDRHSRYSRVHVYP